MILDILGYLREMLPLGVVALLVFALLRPVRNRRLKELHLVSSPVREAALAFFLVFCAGLAALTLFPANFWGYVFDWFVRRSYWHWAWDGWSLTNFYPTWEETLSQIADLPNLLAPFQEIRRALHVRTYWLMFMLLGNIIMFVPIGFFLALLWRKPRWWKSLLIGCGSSITIEFIQFFIGRSTDIDDVILNTTGALVGFWLFCLLRRIAPNCIKKFQCQPRGGYYCG